MREKKEITEEDFSRLLDWLAPARDEAAQKYEEIRGGLIKFFNFRGCSEAETLTDETINRVAVKIGEVEFDGKVKQSTYFYSFASRIYLEDLRKRKRIADRTKEIAERFKENVKTEQTNIRGSVCLEKCLKKHPPQERELFLRYYGCEKSERAAERKKLADEQGINIENLHTKISRLRNTIRVCLKKCLNDVKL
jgi:RNA polymerase sigma factor (sigma-70 family)